MQPSPFTGSTRLRSMAHTGPVVCVIANDPLAAFKTSSSQCTSRMQVFNALLCPRVFSQTHSFYPARLFRIMRNARHVLIVQELVTSGSLHDLTRGQRMRIPVTEQFIRRLLVAVYHCHNNNIDHEDEIRRTSLCIRIRVPGSSGANGFGNVGYAPMCPQCRHVGTDRDDVRSVVRFCTVNKKSTVQTLTTCASRGLFRFQSQEGSYAPAADRGC